MQYINTRSALLAILFLSILLNLQACNNQVAYQRELPLNSNKEIDLVELENPHEVYLSWYLNHSDTLAYFIQSDTLYRFRKNNLNQPYKINPIKAFPTIRKGDYLSPVFLPANESTYSISDDLSNQKLAIHKLEDNSYKLHIIPRRIKGFLARFVLNDLYPPITIGDSIIILKCDFPNLSLNHETKELYSLGIDAVFKLKGDSLGFIQLIGRYPSDYQKSSFTLNDFYPSRSSTADRIFYSFKYDNNITYYQWNVKEGQFIEHFLYPDKHFEVGPIEVLSTEEFFDGRSSKKQFEEPGFLDLEIDENDGSIYRIYRAQDSIKEFNPRRDLLYREDFYLLKYSSELEFIKSEYQAPKQVIMNLHRSGSLFWFNALENSNVCWFQRSLD